MLEHRRAPTVRALVMCISGRSGGAVVPESSSSSDSSVRVGSVEDGIGDLKDVYVVPPHDVMRVSFGRAGTPDVPRPMLTERVAVTGLIGA
jgi:hypothetical protein